MSERASERERVRKNDIKRARSSERVRADRETFIKKYWYPPGCDFEGPLVFPVYTYIVYTVSPGGGFASLPGLPDQYHEPVLM